MSLFNAIKLLLISLVVIAAPQQVGATTVLPVSLQKMSSTAEIIFYGKVIANQSRIDDVSGQIATFTTFEVINILKGNTDSTHTIKQIGGHLPDSNHRLVIKGVPRFYLNSEYIVFLPRESSLGFNSPVGLSQGKFDVLESAEGKIVSNGRSAASLAGKTPSAKVEELPNGIHIHSQSFDSAEGGPSQILMEDFIQTVSGMACKRDDQ